MPRLPPRCRRPSPTMPHTLPSLTAQPSRKPYGRAVGHVAATVGLTLVVAATPAPAAEPGFDCRYAKLRVEKSICANPKLAKLDVQLNHLYNQLIRHPKAQPERIRRAQDEWRGSVRNACQDEACLLSAYESGINGLQASLTDLNATSNLAQQAAPRETTRVAARDPQDLRDAREQALVSAGPRVAGESGERQSPAARPSTKQQAIIEPTQTLNETANHERQAGGFSLPRWLVGRWGVQGQCNVEFSRSNQFVLHRSSGAIASNILGVEVTQGDLIVHTPEAVRGYERVGGTVLKPVWVDSNGQRRPSVTHSPLVKCADRKAG